MSNVFYGICATIGDPTYMCPILQEDAEHVNATGEFQNYRNKISIYQNAYKSSWKPNHNISYNPRPLYNTRF